MVSIFSTFGVLVIYSYILNSGVKTCWEGRARLPVQRALIAHNALKCKKEES